MYRLRMAGINPGRNTPVLGAHDPPRGVRLAAVVAPQLCCGKYQHHPKHNRHPRQLASREGREGRDPPYGTLSRVRSLCKNIMEVL
jgi:hypothetical protein